MPYTSCCNEGNIIPPETSALLIAVFLIKYKFSDLSKGYRTSVKDDHLISRI